MTESERTPSDAPADPLAALVDLVRTPSPRGDAPSEALARWAREQEQASSSPPPASPPSVTPAATPPVPVVAIADPAAPATESPFAVLSLDALRGATDPDPAGPTGSPPREAPIPTASTTAPAPVPTPAVETAPAARPAQGAAASGPFDGDLVEDDEEDEADEADDDGPRGGRSSRRGGARGVPSGAPVGPFWRWGFPVIVLVVALLLPVLVLAGKRTVLQSTDGRLLGQVTDPAAPGWQAITDPTATLLLVQTDAAGTANGLTVMSLTGDQAGGIIFIPMTTVLELPGIGNIPLDAAAKQAGFDGLQKAVEGVLGVGMAEVAVVDPDGWADLVAPLGTLDVQNPDDVKVAGENGEKVVVFPKGTITLAPTDVARYLQTLSPGENDLNRLVRHQAFWEAWLRKVGTSADPNVVPGESTSGLGRFVRALAADRVDMAPLPVQGASIPGSDLAVYLPVHEQVTSLVARLVPFPIGAPPGARPRVRLLDGTGTLDHGLGAVAIVVAAGGQVDQIGNADPFGAATTTFQYSDDARLPEVEALRAGLGVGDIVKVSSPQTAIDVTITLGADYAAQPPPSLAPVTTAVR